MGTPNKLSQQVDETGATVNADVIVDPNNPSRQMTVNADGSINIAGSITATNPSVGTDAATAPTSATEMGGIDGSGNIQGLKVDASTNLQVVDKNSAAEKADLDSIVTNTTGIATAANQATANSSLAASKTDLDAISAAAGTTADSAVTNPASSASDIALLKGVLTRLGFTLAADNTNEMKVSVYGKNTSAGDTALLLDALGQMTIEQFVTYQTMQGHGYGVTTGQVASATNNNVYLGLELIANSITKNVLVYSVVVTQISTQADSRINLSSSATADTNITTNLASSVVNGSTGVTGGSALSSVLGSPANFTAPASGSLIGSPYVGPIGCTANTSVELLGNGKVVFMPKNTVMNMIVYAILATAAQKAVISANWIEW